MYLRSYFSFGSNWTSQPRRAVSSKQASGSLKPSETWKSSRPLWGNGLNTGCNDMHKIVRIVVFHSFSHPNLGFMPDLTLSGSTNLISSLPRSSIKAIHTTIAFFSLYVNDKKKCLSKNIKELQWCQKRVPYLSSWDTIQTRNAKCPRVPGITLCVTVKRNVLCDLLNPIPSFTIT